MLKGSDKQFTACYSIRMAGTDTVTRTEFETHPSRYKHWKLTFEGELAKLVMAVDSDHPHKPGYELKLNSYDLSVDIELADAVQRIRFEHPEVKVLVVTAVRGCASVGAASQPMARATFATESTTGGKSPDPRRTPAPLVPPS